MVCSVVWWGRIAGSSPDQILDDIVAGYYIVADRYGIKNGALSIRGICVDPKSIHYVQHLLKGHSGFEIPDITSRFSDEYGPLWKGKVSMNPEISPGYIYPTLHSYCVYDSFIQGLNILAEPDISYGRSF